MKNNSFFSFGIYIYHQILKKKKKKLNPETFGCSVYRSPLFDMMMMVELIKSMFQAINRPIKKLDQLLSAVSCRLSFADWSLARFKAWSSYHTYSSKTTTCLCRHSGLSFQQIQHWRRQGQCWRSIPRGRAQVEDFHWKKNSRNITKDCFELRFDEKHRDLVFDSYIPIVESKKRILEKYTYSDCYMTWDAKSLDHHSTFETIVMKEELKRGLIKDLDRFMSMKDYYTRVWR